MHMHENAEEIPQDKSYQQYLEKTGNKAELIDRFTHYVQQDQVRSKLKRNVILNSRDVTYRINRCELKTMFTSKHKVTDTKNVYCCSSFNISCTVKAKDTDILYLMIAHM